MASHFQCLGFPLTPEGSSEEDVVALVGRICGAAEPLPAPEGFRAFRWGEEGGAAAFAVLAMDPGDGSARVQCLTPTFLGTTRVRARVSRALPDAECPFCDFLQVEIPAEGDTTVPLLLEVKDPGFSREGDLRGADLVLQVNLLAQRVEALPDGEALRAAFPEGLPPERLEPTGLSARPVTARVRLTGRTGAPRRLRNPLGGGEFHHATVRLPGGAAFDLLAAAEDLPGGFVDGGLVVASCSVVGRIVERAA